MSDAIIVPNDDFNLLNAMSAEELYAEFRRRFEATVESLTAAARVIRVAEDRGIDVEPMRNGLFDTLRKLAHNQILPGLLPLMHRPLLFRLATSLPIPEQRKITDDQPFRVITGLKPDGEFDFAEIMFCDMNDDQRKQVFTRDGLRTDNQQWQELKRRQPDTLTCRVQFTITVAQEQALAAKARSARLSVPEFIRHVLESLGHI